MPRPKLGDEELEFEDMLANFEKKFSRCERGRDLYDKKAEKVRSDESSFFGAKQIELELQILLQEMIKHILQNQNKVATSPTSPEDVDFSSQMVSSGISKEVFKNEIRVILSQLRTFQSTSESDVQANSHRVTVKSLKRILEERTKELDTLQGKCRQLGNNKYRLEEKVNTLHDSIADCQRRHIPMETELLELREQNEYLRRDRQGSEQAINRFTAEKHRFQTTIARFREELELAHHQSETARLEALQARNHAIELEHRWAESKASSTAVSARVKELQEVQDAMVVLMKEAQESSDVKRVRRNLADLGEKRSRLVGRIANLLTKGRHADNASNIEPKESKDVISKVGPSTPERSSPNQSPLSNDVPVGPFDTSVSSTENNTTGPNSPDTTPRKPILDGLRRIGTELARSTTHKHTQRMSILANVEKSRVAIENDSALREVIEMKEKELERMEDELHNAKEKAAFLERSLQKERQRKRLEPRSVPHQPAPNTTALNPHSKREESSPMNVTRRKSLFGWQANETESEGDGNPFTAPVHPDGEPSEDTQHT